MIVEAFDAQTIVTAAVLSHQVSNFLGPNGRFLWQALSCSHVRGSGGDAHLIYGINPGRQMFTAIEFKKNDWPLERQKKVAGGIAGGKDLHIPRIGSVTNVDGINEETGTIIELCHLLAHPIEAVVAQTMGIYMGWRGLIQPHLF
jgi:hypothetical protein